MKKPGVLSRAPGMGGVDWPAAAMPRVFRQKVTRTDPPKVRGAAGTRKG